MYFFFFKELYHHYHVIFSLQAKVKAKDLRGKTKEDLLKQLDELKNVSTPFENQFQHLSDLSLHC